MTDLALKEEGQIDYLSMSDEEMMNASAPAPRAIVEAAPVEEDTPTEEVVVEPESSADDEEDAGTASDEGVKEPVEKQEKDTAPEQVVTEDAEKEPVKKEEVSSVDFEAEYKRMLAPFKANGRDISVNSVDDAIALMQMGANYNKKMAGLKPNLKLMKLLENNGLLSEEKLSYLIDLDKKNPEAINKLMKDSGMDPMDLDAEKASGYKPNTYTVDDREMELDAVLDEIQGTPAYNRTLDIVSTKWDGPSKQVIAGSPQLLKVINDHVQSGIYDIIISKVDSERVFGRLNGLSDIEAYRQVGDAIQARGGFNHLGSSQAKTPTAPVVVTPKPKKVEDDKLNDKRRAASSTKPAAPSVAPVDFNPLSMSDEEFSNMAVKRF